MRRKPWHNEFLEFLRAPAVQPPQWLSERILAFVHAALNPSPWAVFSKLALIQVFTGALVLSICPPFGINLGILGHGMMHLFMRFGEEVCAVACGALLTISSALVASIVLRPAELRVIRRNELLQFLTLSLVSLGGLICMGASVILGFGLLWLLGATMGGLVTLEICCFVRFSIQQTLRA